MHLSQREVLQIHRLIRYGLNPYRIYRPGRNRNLKFDNDYEKRIHTYHVLTDHHNKSRLWVKCLIDIFSVDPQRHPWREVSLTGFFQIRKTGLRKGNSPAAGHRAIEG